MVVCFGDVLGFVGNYDGCMWWKKINGWFL